MTEVYKYKVEFESQDWKRIVGFLLSEADSLIIPIKEAAEKIKEIEKRRPKMIIFPKITIVKEAEEYYELAMKIFKYVEDIIRQLEEQFIDVSELKEELKRDRDRLNEAIEKLNKIIKETEHLKD